jgi:hypothetical protein
VNATTALRTILASCLTLAAATPWLGAETAPDRDARFSKFREGRDFPYEFPKYESKAQWDQRATHLRRHILASTGLWPMPPKYGLSPRLGGRIEHRDYVVEQVYFQSYPGFYVTGNLYRPRSTAGERVPAVLTPHGHWATGRLANEKNGSVPGRCINLARQGYVVFAYDMIGYNDSIQLKHDFASPRYEIWGISLCGLQLWNSIRAVDFVAALPEVDASRIGCTGASGGGTQTFLLMAVDDRVKCAAPVNMISAHFQGGCLCENCPSLRLDTYNVEIGALMAPRPLLMVSATGDWTKNTPKIEYPAVRSIYALLGAEDKIHAHQVDAPHNYNLESREAMYAFFGKHLLKEDDPENLKEQPFEVEKDEDLRFFMEAKDLPAKARTEEQLVDDIIERAKGMIADNKPLSLDAVDGLRDSFGSTLKHTLPAKTPAKEDLLVIATDPTPIPGGTRANLIISRKSVGDRIPATLFIPATPTDKAVLLVSDKGQAANLTDDGAPGPLLAGLLAKGRTVLTIDACETGNHMPNEAELEKRKKLAFLTTFNPTTLANRLQDILTASAVLTNRESIAQVDWIAQGDAGIWAILARGLAGPGGKLAADAANFDYNDDNVFIERFFNPSIRRAGDIATALALAAPSQILIHNVGPNFPLDWMDPVYKSAKEKADLKTQPDPATDDALITWIATE